MYVRNLDESIKIPALIEALHGLFDEFGTIVDIVAKKSLRRKGQAFVIYDNVDSAQNAIDDLQGFDLLGKQMSLDFAKARSDATVKREEGDAGLEAHKKHRLAEKGMFKNFKDKQNCHADSICRAQADRGGRSRGGGIGQAPTGRHQHGRAPSEERKAFDRSWWSCAGRVPSSQQDALLA